MGDKQFISGLQSFFGVTKAELSVVAAIVSGLILSVIINAFSLGDKTNHFELAGDIYAIMDSLAEVNRTTYTGTDVANNPIPELAKGDTVVEKESFFPKAPKKEESISGKINLNTASKVELMKLPGVGEKTAITILDYRKSNKFKKASDIMNIKGIGEKKFEKMKPYICVD